MYKLFSSLLSRYFYTTPGSTQFQIPFSKTHIFPPRVPLPSPWSFRFFIHPALYSSPPTPYGWASSYLTSPIPVLPSPSLSCCGTINIFLHCKPNSYTLFDGGVFFLMACPLLDHILVPWGASSRKQGECLFGVILLVSRVHEDGLKSIPVLFRWRVDMHPTEMTLSGSEVRLLFLIGIVSSAVRVEDFQRIALNSLRTKIFRQRNLEDSNCGWP